MGCRHRIAPAYAGRDLPGSSSLVTEETACLILIPPSPPCAAAEGAELAHAVPGLVATGGYPSRTATPLAPLACDIGCSLAGVAGVQLPPSLAGGKS